MSNNFLSSKWKSSNFIRQIFPQGDNNYSSLKHFTETNDSPKSSQIVTTGMHPEPIKQITALHIILMHKCMIPNGHGLDIIYIKQV